MAKARTEFDHFVWIAVTNRAGELVDVVLDVVEEWGLMIMRLLATDYTAVFMTFRQALFGVHQGAAKLCVLI